MLRSRADLPEQALHATKADIFDPNNTITVDGSNGERRISKFIHSGGVKGLEQGVVVRIQDHRLGTING